MGLKSSERSALTRILNNRFDLLEQDIEQRRTEIARFVRERMQAEAKAAMERAEERLRPFIEEANELERRVTEELKAIREAEGVAPGHTYERYRQQERIVSGKKITTQVLYFEEYVNKTPVKVEVESDWTPVGLEQRITDAIDKLAEEAGQGKVNLRKMRADLEEKILLGQVESEEAQKLLAEIPEIDTVLPPLKEVKELLAQIGA